MILLAVVVVRGADSLGYVKLAPLTIPNLTKFTAPCLFYSLNGVLSLAALGSMNLTMYRWVTTGIKHFVKVLVYSVPQYN